MAEPGNLEDLYELTPLQQGMLFHSVYAPEAGAYVTQLHCQLAGPLQPEGFARSWSLVMEAHPVLRTSFHWKGLGRPVQAVEREVDLRVRHLDWSATPREEVRPQLLELMRADRRQGFQVDAAPLMRVMLIRLADERHVLLWTYHHLLLDGWSTAGVLRDVLACYEALLADRTPVLRRVPPFADHIGWLQGRDAAAAEAFWRNELQGFETPTRLPFDRGQGRLASLQENAGQHRLSLPAEDTARIRDYCRGNGITTNTLVQGAWGILLSRYSGAADVLYGTVVSGRTGGLPHIESMVGMFINSLPVRVRVDPAAPTGSWLRELQRRQARARSFEFAALQDIQSWSEVPGSGPLFETLLIFENYPVAESLQGRLGALEVSDVEVVSLTNYPLALMVLPGDSLTLLVDYETERFSPLSVQRLVSSLERLMTGIAAAAPTAPLAALPMLTDAERHAVLQGFNRTERPRSGGGLLDLFASQAARTPRSIAVSDDRVAWTYEELREESARLAGRLRARGVRREELVGVALERSADCLAALLGILEAGAAFVPLDTRWPRERLRAVLQRADVRTVLVDAEGALDGVSPRLERVHVGAEDEHVGGSSPREGTRETHLDCQAYVLHTTGSTGEPKATSVSHRGLANYLSWCAEEYGLSERTRSLVHSSLTFDLTITSLFAPLLTGGTVVMLREREEAFGPALTGQAVQEHRPTLLKVTPSHLTALRLMGPPAGAFASVETLIVGGEQLSGEHVAFWRSASPHSRIINEYGPTETVVGVCTYEVEDGDEAAACVPIGRPIANSRLYVLDEEMRPVPAGAVGELYIGGTCVSRGYLGQPRTTAENFVPDPFGAAPGARLYRSGDRVKLDEADQLVFLGRFDDQVKLRGHRVDVAGVEALLVSSELVKDACVVAVDLETERARLAAYYIPRRSEQSSATLREYLGERLPSAMVPAHFVALDEFPLTRHGKIDRRALPRPTGGGDAQGPPPRSDLERALLRLWREQLDLEEVGVEDNFFDLGANSLLMLRVQPSVSELAGREVPVVELFRHPTIRSLSTHLSGVDRAGPSQDEGLSASERKERRRSLRARRGHPGTEQDRGFER